MQWLTRVLYLSVGFLMTAASPSLAFMFPNMAQKPELLHFTNAQTGMLLNIRLDVGGKESESRMNVKDLLVELLPDPVDKKYGNPKMPGANGPNPQLSSGVRKLKILQPGHFIDMSGANYLDANNGGCYEMVWRDGAAAGMLVCGFDLPKAYRRNDAVLPKGPLFASFPIWTREGLDNKQEFKRKYESMAKSHKEEMKEELEKMQATNNLFMKAWHFRNAAAADEKYSLIPHNELTQVPSDSEIIPLEDNIFLSNKGLVWSKDGSHHFGKSTLLGSALANPGTIGNDKPEEGRNRRP